jgi:hypothetical protein
MTPQTIQHSIIDGKQAANTILQDVHACVERLQAAGWHPRLVSLTIGDTPAARLYVRNQQRACARAGITFEDRPLSSQVTIGEALAAIHALNADPAASELSRSRCSCKIRWSPSNAKKTATKKKCGQRAADKKIAPHCCGAIFL